MNVELCETASVMKEKAEKRKKRACAVRVMHVTLDTKPNALKYVH